jgi:hypothetical protein
MSDEILSVDKVRTLKTRHSPIGGGRPSIAEIDELADSHELLRTENADLRRQLEEALREIRGLLECRCLTCADKARALLVELEAK